MIIGGWGKSARELCSAGLRKCSNCHNTAIHTLLEVKKKATLYFVPVAKWGAKHYLVCSTCSAGIETTPEDTTAILRMSVAIPTPKAIQEMWKHVDRLVHEGIVAKKGGRDEPLAPQELRELLHDCIKSARVLLEGTYPSQHVAYVLERYLESVV